MDRWLSMKFRRQNIERYAQIRSMVLRTPPEGYIGCGLAISGFDIRHRLKEIRPQPWSLPARRIPARPSSTPRRSRPASEMPN
jgi:hypothetical protein